MAEQYTWNPYGYSARQGTGSASTIPWAMSTVGGQPSFNWLPWGDWGQTPWAGVSQDDATKQMAWMNVMLPWLQATTQQNQWGTEFDWRKAQDEWNKQFQEGQFGWQKEQDLWGREQTARQLEADREAANLAAFSRRWRPQTRWA